jgi:hypothetical protein
MRACTNAVFDGIPLHLIMSRLFRCTENHTACGRSATSDLSQSSAFLMCCAPGIFVSDILDAVPLQKFFQLFRPAPGGEGGYILISMNFVKDLSEAKAALLPSGWLLACHICHRSGCTEALGPDWI